MSFAFASSPFAGLARRLRRAVGGNVAMIFALTLPPLAVAAVGGIQLSYVVNVRSTAQDIADSAALAGAQQMSLSPVGAAQRAQSWANTQLQARGGTSTFTVAASALDGHTLKVSIDSYTPSFFGDMLPKGGFRSHAEATAQQQAQAPLCVLIDGAGNDYLKITGSSSVSGSCLVHSNGDIQTDPKASIIATQVETAGAVSGTGTIKPTPLTGAPTVADPFTSLPIPTPACGGGNLNFPNNTVFALLPGVHTGTISFGNNSTVTLLPGDHYFCGDFTVGNNTDVSGSDVVLIFGKNAKFNLANNGTVNLGGRRSQNFSGFVVITARDMTADFHMATDAIQTITGAIYSPAAKLVFDGSKQSGQASDWTVVAAKSLQTTGGANLQINTNYAGSQVTVPIGVGNKASKGGATQLTH